MIGPDKVALIKTVDLLQAGKVRITPDTLVETGSGGEGSNTMFSAYLATLLAQNHSPGDSKPYTPSSERDYESSLTGSPAHQDPSIPLPVGPANDAAESSAMSRPLTGAKPTRPKDGT